MKILREKNIHKLIVRRITTTRIQPSAIAFATKASAATAVTTQRCQIRQFGSSCYRVVLFSPNRPIQCTLLDPDAIISMLVSWRKTQQSFPLHKSPIHTIVSFCVCVTRFEHRKEITKLLKYAAEINAKNEIILLNTNTHTLTHSIHTDIGRNKSTKAIVGASRAFFPRTTTTIKSKFKFHRRCHRRSHRRRRLCFVCEKLNAHDLVGFWYYDRAR